MLINMNECISSLYYSTLKYSSKTFADNLLTPMSSKMSMSFFLQSKKKNKVFDENITGFFSI